MGFGTMVWAVLVFRAGFCKKVGIEDIWLSLRPGTTCSLFREFSWGVVTLMGGVSGEVGGFDAFTGPSTSPLSAGLVVWSSSCCLGGVVLSLSMVVGLVLGSVDSFIGSESSSDSWAFSASEGSPVWLSSSSQAVGAGEILVVGS